MCASTQGSNPCPSASSSDGANDLLQTLDDCGDDPASTDEITKLNDAIAKAARTTRSKLANAYDDFNVPPPQPQRLCRLTLICNQDDIHASNAGYREIANLMFTATRYPARR